MWHLIFKSNSENGIKIRWFLTKSQTKITWLLFLCSTLYREFCSGNGKSHTKSLRGGHTVGPSSIVTWCMCAEPTVTAACLILLCWLLRILLVTVRCFLWIWHYMSEYMPSLHYSIASWQTEYIYDTDGFWDEFYRCFLLQFITANLAVVYVGLHVVTVQLLSLRPSSTRRYLTTCLVVCMAYVAAAVGRGLTGVVVFSTPVVWRNKARTAVEIPTC